MASSYGLECEVLDTEAMTKLGMGALLGVAQGSTNPPFLIVVKYQPEKPVGDGSSGTRRERCNVRYRAAFPLSRLTAWKR